MKNHIKILDIIIILAVIILTVFSAYTAYFKQKEYSQVLIRGQNKEWTFPVDAQETIIVSGPLGYTIVKLQENRAWIESSPCNNQTCVAAGFVHSQGQWTACLPNNVLLIINGLESDDVDTIAW